VNQVEEFKMLLVMGVLWYSYVYSWG
jgi:hypothetical protein